MSFRTVLTLAALVSIPPAAVAVDSPLDIALQPEVTESPLVFTCRACPDARVEFRELEAARPIDWKLALAAAMRAASRSAADDKNRHFGQPGKDGRYVFANSPKEVAKVIRDGLGPTSLVTQGADALASLAHAAERTTQVPLDGLNFVTDAMVDAGRKLGWRQLPRFRLRSKIENDRAGVTLSARW